MSLDAYLSVAHAIGPMVVERDAKPSILMISGMTVVHGPKTG
jgi:hypothetical protein